MQMLVWLDKKVPPWGPNGSARCFILWQSSLTRRWPSLMAFHHKVPYGLYSEWARMVLQHLAGSVLGIHKGNTYHFLVRWMYIYNIYTCDICTCMHTWITVDIYIYLHIHALVFMHIIVDFSHRCVSQVLSFLMGNHVEDRSWWFSPSCVDNQQGLFTCFFGQNKAGINKGWLNLGEEEVKRDYSLLSHVSR